MELKLKRRRFQLVVIRLNQFSVL